MVVVVALVLIWAAVFVPPLAQAHRERQEAFLGSFGHEDDLEHPRARSLRIQRRRQIAGGLLTATVATLLVGLLPTFRVLLVVHLFMLDSFLGYIAYLAHLANRAAPATARPVAEPVVDARPAPVPRIAIAPAG